MSAPKRQWPDERTPPGPTLLTAGESYDVTLQAGGRQLTGTLHLSECSERLYSHQANVQDQDRAATRDPPPAAGGSLSDARDAPAAAGTSGARDLQHVPIPNLLPKVPYLITNVSELPPHPQYKQRYQVDLRNNKNKEKFYVILTDHQANIIGREKFPKFNEDIKMRKNPFLIYKGKIGMAYDVSIKPFSDQLAALSVRGETYLDNEYEWFDAAYNK